LRIFYLPDPSVYPVHRKPFRYQASLFRGEPILQYPAPGVEPAACESSPGLDVLYDCDQPPVSAAASKSPSPAGHSSVNSHTPAGLDACRPVWSRAEKRG